jgi:KaiC/GvpD/RAD55 family RecA-like ATPase
LSNTIQLIKILLNNNNYTKYSNHIEPILKNNKEVYNLYNYLSKLQSRYERDISVEEFSLYVLVNCPEKDRDVFSLLLKQLSAVEEDSLVVDDILVDLTNRKRAYDLALAALEVSEGKKEFTDLLVLAENLNATESVSDSFSGMFVTTDLEELYDSAERVLGLRWRLPFLNQSLGSLRPGDFGFVFARPETGKTTFLASESTHFAEQLREDAGPIIWFNNEERGDKVQLRLYQALFGITLTELLSNRPKYDAIYNERIGNKLKIYDSAAIHRKQVEFLCHELAPSMLIFDQLDKIKGFVDDREDLRLGAIYIWARELAKTYCPTIAVCQADASGEGKKWLTMENVANAKTAKQAEADWILGIGKSHNEAEEFSRYLNINKNKLLGDADTLPELRHGRTTVRIRADIARYEEY